MNKGSKGSIYCSKYKRRRNTLLLEEDDYYFSFIRGRVRSFKSFVFAFKLFNYKLKN